MADRLDTSLRDLLSADGETGYQRPAAAGKDAGLDGGAEE